MQIHKVYMTHSVAESIYRIHEQMESQWQTRGKEFYAILIAKRGALDLITDLRVPVQTISGASVQADKHSLARVAESLSEDERSIGSYHRHPHTHTGYLSTIDDDLLELLGHQLSSDLLTWEEIHQGSPMPPLDLLMGEGKAHVDGKLITGQQLKISGVSLERRPVSRVIAMVNAHDREISFYGKALVKRYCLLCRSSHESFEELDVEIVPGEPCSLEEADLDEIIEDNFLIHHYQKHYGDEYDNQYNNYGDYYSQPGVYNSGQHSQQVYGYGSKIDRILNEIDMLNRKIDRLLTGLEGDNGKYTAN